MSFVLEALPDDIQNLVAVLVALGLAEAFDGEEFLTCGRGEVGYGQKSFLVEDDVGGDVVLPVFSRRQSISAWISSGWVLPV